MYDLLVGQWVRPLAVPLHSVVLVVAGCELHRVTCAAVPMQPPKGISVVVDRPGVNMGLLSQQSLVESLVMRVCARSNTVLALGQTHAPDSSVAMPSAHV